MFQGVFLNHNQVSLQGKDWEDGVAGAEHHDGVIAFVVLLEFEGD